MNRSKGSHDLFQRIAQNDELAFGVFFDQYHTRLIRYAALFTASIQEAEDVVSEVLIKLLKKRQVVFLKENVVGYIFQCIKNESLDHMKKEKRRAGSFDFTYNDQDYFIFDRKTPISELMYVELTNLIRDRIEALPPKRRQVFKLVKDEHMCHKEVAELLGISSRTVEVHLKLALKDMSETLSGYLGSSDSHQNDDLKASNS